MNNVQNENTLLITIPNPAPKFYTKFCSLDEVGVQTLHGIYSKLANGIKTAMGACYWHQNRFKGGGGNHKE